MKLKPCPFCGNEEIKVCREIAHDKKTTIGWSAVCEPDYKPCGAEGPIVDTKSQAAKAWNKRAK